MSGKIMLLKSIKRGDANWVIGKECLSSKSTKFLYKRNIYVVYRLHMIWSETGNAWVFIVYNFIFYVWMQSNRKWPTQCIPWMVLIMYSMLLLLMSI